MSHYHVNEWKRACDESLKHSRRRRTSEPPMLARVLEGLAIILFVVILAAVVAEWLR